METGNQGRTGAEAVSGILEVDPRRAGHLRAKSLALATRPDDAQVSPSFILRHALRSGAEVEGTVVGGGKGKRELTTITQVNGMSPEKWKNVVEFSRRVVVQPTDPIQLEGPRNGTAMRVIDLFAPLGKGQRALIVSPPKAGKTMLLQQIANAVSTNDPSIDVLMLLVDERPEEVTDMRRTVRGEVYGSSSDEDRGAQVRLAQLVLDYARRKAECGRDVLLLLDSLTRLGRAFNIHQKSSGRTMSGGVDARALEIPKRIFGAARTLEGGGSLTIVATALIETNSRMDDLIFQEFKGTGNMELVLDRSMADERVFPAINLVASGTRREEMLFGGLVREHQDLRRAVAKLPPKEAMLKILGLLQKFPTNSKILGSL